MKITALALVAAAALTGWAAPGAGGTVAEPLARAPAPKQCFGSSVNSFRKVDERAVHVRVGAHRIVRLEFEGRCQALETPAAFGLRARTGAAICEGADVDVLTRDLTVSPRCTIRSVQKLSRTEAAALPRVQKPW